MSAGSLADGSPGDSPQPTYRWGAIVYNGPDPKSRDMVYPLPLLPARSILLLLIWSPCLVAQDASQQKLVELREKKLGAAFLKKAPWQTDFDQARAFAKERGQLLFVYFTRSFAP